MSDDVKLALYGVIGWTCGIFILSIIYIFVYVPIGVDFWELLQILIGGVFGGVGLFMGILIGFRKW
jgi:hypothetical protein